MARDLARIQLEMAAKGAVSGVAGEWPLLKKALLDLGYSVDDYTRAGEMKRMAKDALAKGEYGMNEELFAFEEALARLKKGERVARTGWNGKGMFLYLVNGSTFEVNRPPLNEIYREGTRCTYRPHIDMRTADGSLVPWIASQSDLLAEDWYLV